MIEVQNFSWGHEYVTYHNGNKSKFWMPMAPNSAGGYSVRFDVKNHGDKPIKKYSVLLAALNGADEIVKCEASHADIQYVNSADFLDAHQLRKGCMAENLWYNKSIRSVRIVGIAVIYADGTQESFEGNYIPTEEEKAREKEDKAKADRKAALILLVIIGIVAAIYFGLEKLAGL